MLNIYTLHDFKSNSPKTDVTSLPSVCIKPFVGGDIFIMSKIVGIYKITNPKGRVYIGRSIDVAKRKNRYKNSGCKTQTRIYPW